MKDRVWAGPSRRRFALPEPLRGLEELALNLWWSWDPESTRLWDDLAARLGVSGEEWSPRNPVRLLASARRASLETLASDRELGGRIRSCLRRLRQVCARRAPPAPALGLPGPVAYFSMEFGVHESLPIYAGGLGLLAGDHAKAASDLAIPLWGVSLYYREGYFRQDVDPRGRQVVTYPRSRPAELPLEVMAARGSGGQGGGGELRVRVEFPGRVVQLRAWRARVGRVSLILLDSDLPENSARDRSLTHRLYIGDREARISQEVLCGIGGVRALRALGIEPAVWHLNEGHVAFLTLERIRELTTAGGLSFPAAQEVVAADCVFTTHTPVPEGNEVFALGLARRYLAAHCQAAGVPVEEYLRLGVDRDASGRPCLSMTVLGLRLSRFRNGVSRLHGQVSRRMWSRLWPGFSVDTVPIGSVTNGIHTPTWVAPELHELYRLRLGANWTERLDDPSFWRRARGLPDEELWALKRRLKEKLVSFVRERVRRRLLRSGSSEAAAARQVRSLLDPEAFTIGFSRRFALYKRAGLLFSDVRRARRLFNDPRRPVQIIFAGKPHPEDPRGRQLFEEVMALTGRPGFRGKVVLLENYDIEMARYLVQGVDLWLNTPRRPLEACGTSGQKVPINAGLNLSILDGWWDEAYSPNVGWAFGKPRQYATPETQDRQDLRDLYRVLEGEIISLYFQRDARGIPRRWLRKVKLSLGSLVPRFSTAHMLGEYARSLYRPAAENGRRLRAGRGREALAVTEWRLQVERSWPLAHVVRAERLRGRAEVEVFVGGLRPQDLAAEASVDGTSLELPPPRQAGDGIVRFSVPLRDHTPVWLRVWPRHSTLPHPAEIGVALEAEI